MLVTNSVSRDARVQKEAESAAKAGARVVVVGVGQKEQVWVPGAYELRLVEPAQQSGAGNRAVRIAQNLWRARALERRMTREARGVGADIIHCNDLDTLRAGMRAADKRSRVVYDAHELYTEGLVTKLWQKRLLGWRERRLIRRVDAVVTVNSAIGEWLGRRYGLKAVPTVVMNGATVCSEGSRVSTGPVRLFFQGQFFYDRNIEIAIRCMPALRGRATLALQGWGEAEPDLRALVEELAVDDCVQFIPPCEPSEVVNCAREYDVGLITSRPLNLNLLLLSPNKLFDYLGAGLAVVAPSLPVLDEIIGGSGCGVIFSHDGEPSLQSVLDRLVSDRARIEVLKANSVRACHSYSWSVQSEKLLNVYQKVASRGDDA